MSEIDLDNLTEIKEYKAIMSLNNEAKVFIESFDWCKSTVKSWYDFGVYEKVGVFLFQIDPIKSEVDEYIWVIVGDLPSVYLDQSVETGQEALKIYCELMMEWSENVLNGDSISDCYPVPADTTNENALLLKSRIEFIRNEILIDKEE